MKPIEIRAPSILALVKILELFIVYNEELQVYKRERLYHHFKAENVYFLLWEGCGGTFEHLIQRNYLKTNGAYQKCYW